MTVLEAIQKSTEFLGKRRVESPRLQTELLLAHLLKMPRMRLYLNFDRVLTADETKALREFVRRRGQREPLQHITGTTSFCGLEIKVNRQALVPRPETELLVELGEQYIQQEIKVMNGTTSIVMGVNAIQMRKPFDILDFCTGSGCIAIALATKCPEAKIIATDISTAALALARENAESNLVAGQIEFLEGDGFAALKHNPIENAGINMPELFDLIVSNPPYIPSGEIAMLEPEVRDFDPRAALDGGADGLDFYRRIASESRDFLKPTGRIMLEMGDGQAGAIKSIFESEKWIVEAVKEDYSQRTRILIIKSSFS